MIRPREERLTALSALRTFVVGSLAERNVCTRADRGLGAVAAVQGFARDDAVDLCIGKRWSAVAGLVKRLPRKTYQ